MALDSRFVLASDLQEYFVDKDTGTPLANGSITFYSDVNRTTLKPVYELSGSPPNYSYTQLPNPLPLTGVGTISDGAGNDIVPYYFPYDGTPTTSTGTVELYYIVVESQGMALQFTREAWPNTVAASSASQNITNYVPDGQFRIHNDIPATDTTIAGQVTQAITYIAQGGWTFERPAMSTAKDIVLFNVFGSAVTNPTGYPRFSVEIINETPNAGDGFKDLRLKFDDVNKFASTTQMYTFAFSAQSNTGGSISATLILIKNFGTPNGSMTQETPLATLTISPSYTILQKSFVFGTNEAFSIGSNNDDFLQLAIRFPVASVFDVSLTDFVLTPGNIMVAQFPTTTDAKFRYESIAGWMPTPAPDGSDLYLPLRLTAQGLEFDHSEVGKICAAMYDLPGSGELLCDGTQYETSAYSTVGIPYSRLQKVLYNSTLNIPRFGTGLQYLTNYQDAVTTQSLISTNFPGAAMDTADGTPGTGFTFAKIHAGADYGIMGHLVNANTIYAINDFIGSSPGASAGTSGFTVSVIRNGTSFLKQIVTIVPVAATGLAGTYFSIGSTIATYYVWFTVNGSGADPAPGGTGIKVDLLSTYTAADVALIVTEALNGAQITRVDFVIGSMVPAGSYFTVNNFFNGYYVWYTVDGAGTDPKPNNRIPIAVAILSTDTAAQVMMKTQKAINGKYFAVPDLRGQFLRGWNHGATLNLQADPEAENRWTNSLLIHGDAVGTQQIDEILSHHHGYLYGNMQQSAVGVDEVTPNNFATNTTDTGGFETRPINTYVNFVIKY